MKREYRIGQKVHCNYAGVWRVDGKIVGKDDDAYLVRLLHGLRRRGMKEGDEIKADASELSLFEN